MISTQIKIFDTKSRADQNICISNDKFLRVYGCGPTVYRDAHVGNMRTFLLADLLIRLSKQLGYQVKFIQNITDVGHMSEDFTEDKMLAQAKLEAKDPFDVARDYEAKFHTDLKLLNIQPADLYPKASESIELMQKFITDLIASNNAYVGEDDCVYFAAQSFPTYGAISGNKLESLKPGHRFDYTEDGAKHFHADWALWKAAAGRTQMIWPSPWGPGFPGWHIECSAMSLKFLDNFVDLHLGGIDLRFPHHENERAQSNSAISNSDMNNEAVALWVHGEHLLFEGRKMSKSAGNVVLVAELITKGLDPLSLRVCFLENRYRSQMDLTWQSLATANQLLERWRGKLHEWKSATDINHVQIKDSVDQILQDFCTDLDTPRAMQKLREVEKSSEITDASKCAIFIEADKLFGLDLARPPKPKAEANQAQRDLLAQRTAARNDGNFAESDRLRDLLKAQGIEVRDNPDGQSWIWLI
jgi:cysteinyl-tRNA synthetase